MSRFTISSLFAPWLPASQPPRIAGWYRTRTEALTHSWWNQMAYWDGEYWWEFGQFGPGPNGLAVRRSVPVLQWQGLRWRPQEAARVLLANLPRTPAVRKRYERFALETLGVSPEAVAAAGAPR